MAQYGRHRAVAPPRPKAAPRAVPKEGSHASGRRARRPRRELIAGASGAALLAVIGAFWGWAHHSLAAAQPAAPTTAATVAAPAAAPPPSEPMRAQLRSWLAQAGPSIDALLDARHDIASAASTNDVAGTGATCENAKGAVAALQRYLPTPDARLTNAFQQAINRYDAGLRHCIAGAHHHDGHDMAQAATYLRQANGELQAAVDLVAAEVPGAGSPYVKVLTV